ncbi:MAG: starch-binding protein [Acutalibacteraceae bacterium]
MAKGKFFRKTLCVILTLCMVLSVFVVPSVTATAASESTQSAAAGNQGPQSSIQGSAVLHCFNWSYNSIKSNLAAIKAAGYTAVQTSPVQKPKDYNSGWKDQKGQWWKLYQPLNIAIADGGTWLGTKAELKAMCDEAEKLGIKVIVDIVANHMANVDDSLGNSMSNINSSVDSALKSNSSYWHINGIWANDGSRYDMTMGSIGQPDLNTGNTDIQNKYKALLIDCINQGVDGFRFDAAKHIELPSDSNSSQFWPTVINGSKASTSNEVYYYGEILNGCATSISNYTKYMSITDNNSGDAVLVAANNSNASGVANSSYKKGAGADKSVIWAESHDTYMGSSGSAGLGNTSGVSNATITKAWAIIGSRSNSTALYFARPAANMGAASTDTTWKSTAVAEVNKFKNYFDGQTESLSSEGDVAYNERGTAGVVISKMGGAGSVNVTARKMAAGTYKDQVSGNTFTVSNGKISGTVGSTGVAVVYNATAPGPAATVTPGSCTYKTDTLTLTLKYDNATSGQYSVDGGSYQSFTNGKTITIGAGKPYGTVTTVAVKAADASKTSQPVTYTYTKADPNAGVKIYFDNSSYNWSNVYAYIYDNSSTPVVENAAWPGAAMTKDSLTGLYVIEVPEELQNGKVIFTESYSATTNRYPADGQEGMSIGGTSKKFSANNKWEDYSAVKPTNPPTKPPTDPPTDPTTDPPTNPDGKYMLGDANMDGKISLLDVMRIQEHIAKIHTLTGLSKAAADVNANGELALNDILEIQKHLAKINTSYKIGEYFGADTPTDPPTEKPTEKPTETPTDPPTAPSSSTINVYFSSKWSNVKAYIWNNASEDKKSEWPGDDVSGIEKNPLGETIYKATVDLDKYDRIIFSGSGGQTVDITLTSDSDGTGYYITSKKNQLGHYEVAEYIYAG